MSQIFKATSGSSPVVTDITFVTDASSPAVTSSSTLTMSGSSTSAFVSAGIETIGSAGGSTLQVALTNIFSGTATTAGAVATTLLSQTLGATPGSFFVKGSVLAYNSTDLLGGAYELSICIRTSGAAATLIGASVTNVFTEGAMSGIVVTPSISVNSLVITVTGLAGKTIKWDGHFNIRFAG